MCSGLACSRDVGLTMPHAVEAVVYTTEHYMTTLSVEKAGQTALYIDEIPRYISTSRGGLQPYRQLTNQRLTRQWPDIIGLSASYPISSASLVA